MPHLLKETPYALVEEAACWSHTYHIRRFVEERNGQFGFFLNHSFIPQSQNQLVHVAIVKSSGIF